MTLRIVVCLTAIAWVSGTGLERPIYDLERAAELFQEFKETYNKTYNDDDEHDMRRKVFTDNLVELNYLNSLNEALYDINMYADLTNEELHSYRRCVHYESNVNSDYCQIKQYKPSGSPPASLDYRKNNMVTSVKAQGDCGACYAFSAMGAIEGQYAKKHQSLVSFSAQQIIDCDKIDKGCEGGLMYQVFDYVHQNGLETEADYPYNGQQKKCAYDKSKSKVKLSSCVRLKISKEEDMKSALNEYGPISISVDSSSASFHKYRGGILKTCSSNGLTHGILLVGYGKEGSDSYWIVKNSWGEEDWGEQGFGRILMGSNTCMITEDLSVPQIQ